MPQITRPTFRLSLLITPPADAARDGLTLVERVARLDEAGLSWMLRERGLRVERQVPIPIVLFGQRLEEGFRADLLIEDLVIVEIKAVVGVAAVHRRQVLTYLRLSDRWLGLLVNFGGPLLKDGFERIVNGEPRTGRRPISAIPVDSV